MQAPRQNVANFQFWEKLLRAKSPMEILKSWHVCNRGVSMGSFNLCQLFENPVVKVRKKGWHSLKYCVNMVIICVNMVIIILCIKKRLNIELYFIFFSTFPPSSLYLEICHFHLFFFFLYFNFKMIKILSSLSIF